MTPRIWCSVGLFVAATSPVFGSRDPMPAGLVQAALQNYPQGLLCGISSGDRCFSPTVPLSSEVRQGWLAARIANIKPAGPQVAVVLYSRCNETQLEKVFVQVGDLWQPAPFQGFTQYVIDQAGCSVDLDNDVVFNDVDHDGANEIVLYFRSRHPHHGWPTAVVVLAYRSGALVPVTDVEFEPPHPGRLVDGCLDEEGSLNPRKAFRSDTGVGFVDLDNDGFLELLMYPNLGEKTDPDYGARYYAPVTGTRVFKLVNGVYTFQYETAVGAAGTPPVAAALKPASVSVAELQGAGSGGGGGQDDAVALYVMPPASYTLDDVDWTTARVGDFTITSSADRGDNPAPRSPDAVVPGWQPWQNAGQPVFIENLAGSDQGNFQQKDKDPMIYIGINARLRCATPFRELRFSKKSLFTWAWQKWQASAGDQQLKGCLPQGDHQRCFTPLHIPVKANLTGNRGFAMGEAILWIETKEAAASPTATPTPAH